MHSISVYKYQFQFLKNQFEVGFFFNRKRALTIARRGSDKVVEPNRPGSADALNKSSRPERKYWLLREQGKWEKEGTTERIRR